MDDQLRTKIELEDKFENMGAQMVREVASKTSDQAGDGTTTATVLAHAIVREGSKGVAAGMNPMDLKGGVDLAVEAVVGDLHKNSKKVTSNKEIAQVGTFSANGDAEIGRFLADVFGIYFDCHTAEAAGRIPQPSDVCPCWFIVLLRARTRHTSIFASSSPSATAAPTSFAATIKPRR